MKVALMVTCLSDVLRPEVGIATVNLLRRLGHQVEFPTAQTCCGQPMFNSGFAELARDQARHTIKVFNGDFSVVVPSGSCAAMVKVEYPHLFDNDPDWHRRAVDLAQRTHELSQFLVRVLNVTDVGAKFEGKVAYHFACHGRMLGGINSTQPTDAETLLGHVQGLTLVPLARQDQCCGFGGSFSVRYPEISTAMVNDKVNCLVASGADTVVSTDLGCLMNIGGRLRRRGEPIQVLHLAEVLDRH
jgi:L-lactate dehydrogenase complex protein LldE